MKKFNILPTNKTLQKDLQNKIDNKTKPRGSLGRLEEIALQIGLIQNTLSPSLNKPSIVIFAGDHGIAKDGVSAFPQDVTYQMVMNFLNGGAAINVFAKQNDIDLKIVDAGVNFDFPEGGKLINAKIGKSTKSFLNNDAMSEEEMNLAIGKGAEIVQGIFDNGSNVIGFGEMGIGNTSSASMIMSYICQIDLKDCVGRGTGLDKAGLTKKLEILQKAKDFHGQIDDAEKILSSVGGFEIAMMTGAILKAAELKMVILIDGFITTSALLIAHKLNPAILDYCVFSHSSNESGHKKMLEFLNVKPLMNLDLRLGEGSGAAIAYPLVKSATAFLNEMASFESAGVSEKKD